MSEFPPCPKCQSEYVYQDQFLFCCPECSHEWTFPSEATEDDAVDAEQVTDSNGVALSDGDTVIVIKDLKVKGASSVVKKGTKVKNIRLVDASNGHDIDCKIPDFGSMQLKSEFVKKV